jgi:hypothetical protein
MRSKRISRKCSKRKPGFELGREEGSWWEVNYCSWSGATFCRSHECEDSKPSKPSARLGLLRLEGYDGFFSFQRPLPPKVSGPRVVRSASHQSEANSAFPNRPHMLDRVRRGIVLASSLSSASGQSATRNARYLFKLEHFSRRP